MMNSSRTTFVLIAAAISVATSAHGETVPYKARVIVPAANLQSGPSNTFYPTDTLPEGAEVEVYREEPNGWCAIRPPESSFSWVYGRHLRELDDSLAEITKDDVASRIGSRLHDKRNAVQIRLQRGEVVQLQGEENVDGQTWYKIAPPAGEFRWVHRSSIEQIGRIESAPPAGDEIVAVAATNASDNGAAPRATSEPLVPVESAPPSDSDQWRPSVEAAAVPDNAAGQDKSAPPAPDSAPKDLARQLADIELRLSRTVTGPPYSWNIESLEHEAEQLLAAASTPADRETIKTTLAKLDRFATIQRRYARTTPIPATSQPAANPLSIATSSPPAAGPANGAPYDAVGILRPVVSKRPGAPQYALVDERGQVVSFVTPTPDVNLQPYLGHRIGIAGHRGFIPEFNRAHVTAGRVAPLADRLVR